jgi:AmmeMemoRadiSam system protein A
MEPKDSKDTRREPHEFHNPLIELAYNAIQLYLKGRVRIAPPRAFYKILESKAACFVSLKKHGELRGCMGTIEHAEVTLGREIISNAIRAATGDPRFPPVTLEELDEIDITVDVLERMRECNRDSLDPKEFGIVIEQGERRGVLLPNLPGVDTVDRQIEIAARKAGIDIAQDYRIFRFRADRYDKDSVVT